MSRQNRPAAKAARLGERERPPAAARIAEAVHQAVCEVTGSDGFSHCALYARAGAMAASLATGVEYTINAGCLEVGTGTPDPEDPKTELYLGMDPALSGYSGREFLRGPSGGRLTLLRASCSPPIATSRQGMPRMHAEATGLPGLRSVNLKSCS
ncbi:MAG: hypothetical protein ACREHV_05400 [Rhizomicrobium sp.]